MTIVEPDSDWELELLMPENRMGFINAARKKYGDDLYVEYITKTAPGVTLVGKIKEIGHTAEVRGESGNTVLVRVAIDKSDLTSEPRPGATVTAKVRVGRASIGYVWFHDLISFVQSKILFKIW